MVATYFPGRGTLFEETYLEGKAEGKVEGRAEGKVEGRAEGKAEGVLRVLEGRGIAVSDEVRERIATCTDLPRVDAWLDRVGTVERVEDLFVDDQDDDQA
uniref:Transposase n=2 Tax=unclassified Streptomyces TaxID=2593676 RepID=A0AAU1HXD2_9ACTN